MAGRWLHAATALLLPLCSRSLDRRLLLRYPLLWRSRLLPVAWSAAPATLLAVGVGVALGDGMSSQNAWIGVEILKAVSLCVYAAIVGAALWARVVMAHVAGPLTPARWLRAIGFNALALLAIFVPAHALDAVLSHRVATVMPDAEFAKEWSYHQSHHFWTCMPGDASSTVVRELARLEVSLRRFGVATQGKVSNCKWLPDFRAIPPCEQYNHCLVMENADGTTDTQLLERRLERISMHKARWSPVRLATWLPDDGLLALQLGVTAALAVLLSLPGVDRQNVGPGDLLRSTLGRWMRRLSLRRWLPAFVRDYDRRLLLTAPLVWATGAPIVALGAAALGLLLAGLMAATALLPGSVLEWISKEGEGGLSVFLVSFVTAIQPVWWALVAQRRPVPLLRRRQMFALLGGLCVTCLAVPVVLLLAAGVFDLIYVAGSWWDEYGDVAVFALLVGLLPCLMAIAGRVIATVVGAAYAVGALAITLPMVAAPAVIATFSGEAPMIAWGLLVPAVFGISALLLAAVARSKSALSAAWGRFSLLIVGLAPAVVVSTTLLAVVVVSDLLPRNGRALMWSAALAFALLTALVFCVGLMPCVEVLVRWRRAPVAE